MILLFSWGAIAAILLCIGLPITIAFIVWHKEDSFYPEQDIKKTKKHFVPKECIIEVKDSGLFINNVEFKFPINMDSLIETIGSYDRLFEEHYTQPFALWQEFGLTIQYSKNWTGYHLYVNTFLPHHDLFNEDVLLKTKIIIDGRNVFTLERNPNSLKKVFSPKLGLQFEVTNKNYDDNFQIHLRLTDASRDILIKQKMSVPENRQKFDKVFDVFSRLGFKLNEGISKDELYIRFKPEANNLFKEMLWNLAGSSVHNLDSPVSDECWLLYYELEGEEPYIDIIENFSRLTKGELLFNELEGEISDGQGYVSFVCNGKKYKWEFDEIMSKIDEKFFWNLHLLTEEWNTNKRFAFFEDDALIFTYMTDKEMKSFVQETGIEINRFKKNLFY